MRTPRVAERMRFQLMCHDRTSPRAPQATVQFEAARVRPQVFSDRTV